MATTREIYPIDREGVIELLRTSLRIEVKKSSEYMGGMDGSESLYSDSHTVQLFLGDEVISEAYL